MAKKKTVKQNYVLIGVIALVIIGLFYFMYVSRSEVPYEEQEEIEEYEQEIPRDIKEPKEAKLECEVEIIPGDKILLYESDTCNILDIDQIAGTLGTKNSVEVHPEGRIVFVVGQDLENQKVVQYKEYGKFNGDYRHKFLFPVGMEWLPDPSIFSEKVASLSDVSHLSFEDVLGEIEFDVKELSSKKIQIKSANSYTYLLQFNQFADTSGTIGFDKSSNRQYSIMQDSDSQYSNKWILYFQGIETSAWSNNDHKITFYYGNNPMRETGGERILVAETDWVKKNTKTPLHFRDYAPTKII